MGVCDSDGYLGRVIGPDGFGVAEDFADDADAEFIAHAREDVPRMVDALRGVLRQADALDELAASPIGASYAGALRLGARGIRHAITKALGVES